MHPRHTQNSFLPRQTEPFDAAAELKRATSTGLPPVGAKAQSQKASTSPATSRSRTTQVVDAFSAEPKRDPFFSQAGQPVPSGSRPPRKLSRFARRMIEGKPLAERIVKPTVRDPRDAIYCRILTPEEREGLMRLEQEALARRHAMNNNVNNVEEDK